MAERLGWGYPPAGKNNGLEAAPEGAKRRYEAHFVSKLTDCDGLRLVGYPPAWMAYGQEAGSEREANETDSSLDFAKACGYISEGKHKELTSMCSEIGRMLGGMMKKASSFSPVPFQHPDL